MNPQDLTGRDLDIALTGALGYSTHFPMGLDEPRKIPDLFAKIRKRLVGHSVSVDLVMYANDLFDASTSGTFQRRQDHTVTGSTPNEALARLLLMVIQR